MPSNMRYSIAISCLLLIAATCASAKVVSPHKRDVRLRGEHTPPLTPSRHALDLNYLPQNIAVLEGESTVTFSCWVDPNVAGVPRVQWMEYAYNPDGQLISENGVILAHPQAARYASNITSPNQYDLIISNIALADGGVYTCSDLGASVPQKQRAAAQLVVLANDQNCTTTVPDDGSIVEGIYYTHECIQTFQGNIVPYLTWTGPAPFSSGQTNTTTRVWSGLAFTADRTMTGQNFHLRTNFTGNFLPAPVDTATNIPDYSSDYLTVRMTVNWAPKDMYADPVKPLDEYLVGDIIYCYADAFPSADFQWTNTRTSEVIYNQDFQIPAYWQGFNQLMRCTASNTINGSPYTLDLFINVNVPTPTTTPVPTTPPTTTTAPPVSDCLDLTGRWVSVAPSTGDLCVAVNASNGGFNGGFRNGTDSFWALTVGSTHLPNNEHMAFSIIWPGNVAVSSLIGECSRCYGTEVLLVSAITRSKGTVTCGVPGDIRYSDEYTFYRSDLACPEFRPPSA